MVLPRQRRFAGGNPSKAASRDLGMRLFAFGRGIVGTLSITRLTCCGLDLVYEVPGGFLPVLPR